MTEYIFFDLDGTLTNPELGIINSVIYALKRFSIDVDDRKSLHCFIGPPLVESFMEHFGFSKEDAVKALYVYREYFSKKGLYENEVFAGIKEMLTSLKSQGKKLIVATSKPEEYAKKILLHFDLLKFFDSIVGATMDEKRNKKDEVISYALKTLGIKPEDVVMVGDRSYDITGAHRNGVRAVGVLYGFGNREELENAGADYIVNSVEELEKLLLQI